MTTTRLEEAYRAPRSASCRTHVLRPADGVDGVGVGSSRADVLGVVPDDRMIGDTEDGVIVTGTVLTRFDVDDADTVMGIGSGRLDCTAGAN